MDVHRLELLLLLKYLSVNWMCIVSCCYYVIEKQPCLEYINHRPWNQDGTKLTDDIPKHMSGTTADPREQSISMGAKWTLYSSDMTLNDQQLDSFF